jgi:hypothetical protein
MSQANFQKRQREKDRREKAAAKRERKAQRAESSDEPADEEAAPTVPQDRVLAELAALHASFEAEQIDFDEFEDRKRELIAQLAV